MEGICQWEKAMMSTLATSAAPQMLQLGFSVAGLVSCLSVPFFAQQALVLPFCGPFNV